MKEIELTKGQVAVVDDEDYDSVIKHSWYAAEACGGGYYAKGRNKNTCKLHYMHRFILERMLGRPIGKKMCSDHINGNKLDNRRCNLREVTQTQNRYNSGRCKRAKGYYFDKLGKSYFTLINENGEQKRVGKFATKEEAAAFFWEQKRRIIGDFQL